MAVMEAPNIQTSKTSSAVKLRDKIKEADDYLQPFRDREVEFEQKFQGRYYGRSTGQDHEPLQMLHALVGVLQPNLAIDPECTVTSYNTELAEFAGVFREAINLSLEEIKFAKTVCRVILDSLFMLGITKTGQCDRFSPHWDEQGNYLADPGKVFVSRVKFHNWIGDLKADVDEEMEFQGDRYLMNKKQALDVMRGRRKEVEQLSTMQVQPGQRPEESVTGKRSLDDYLIEKVQFADIWLPSEDVIVTMAGDPDSAGDHYLHEREYKGPEGGPYDYWQLSEVPNNFLQVPLIAVVKDLHDLMNSIARKMQRQAEREKQILLVPLGKTQDNQAVRESSDGDTVEVSDPKLYQQVSYGGADQAGYQIVAWCRDFLNMLSGNPELIGGTGPQANTLGQDEMNKASAGTRVAYYRKRLLDTAGSVLRKVAWHRWLDPIWTRDMTLTTKTGVPIPIRWTPDLREGDFLDFNFAIDANVKRGLDPDEQYQRVVQWLTTVVFPLQQIGAMQGQLLQADEVVRITGQLLGIREAGRMFKRGAPLMMGGGGGLQSTNPKPRTAYADNRVVRRLPAKPPPVETPAEQLGVET